MLDVVMPCVMASPQTYLSGQLWKCASNNLMKLGWPLLKDEKEKECVREREREWEFLNIIGQLERVKERERERERGKVKAEQKN
jgi:hypothetical protein